MGVPAENADWQTRHTLARRTGGTVGDPEDIALGGGNVLAAAKIFAELHEKFACTETWKRRGQGSAQTKAKDRSSRRM